MKDYLSDFDPPKAQRPSRILRSLPTIGWVILFGFLGFVVPRFEAVFGDFGVDLPRFSVVMIRASHAVSRYAPGLLFFAALAWMLVLFSPEQKSPSRKTLIVLFLIPMALLALSTLAVALPMLSLGKRLGG